MEILHVPSACALLWTLSIISPLVLMMDSLTRGTFCRRYWEEVTAMSVPYVTNIADYVTLIWEQWTLQSNAHTFFALTVFQHISAEELREIYHSYVQIAGQFLTTLYVIMNQQTVAIGLWILHHLLALVTHMKKGVYVIRFAKSWEIATMRDATRRCTDAVKRIG